MKFREFNLRERAEIVVLAEKCAKELSAQSLIDYFNKVYRTRFENNGTTIADTIINKYYPDCNEAMRDNLHMIMLDFIFAFEATLVEGDDVPLLTATIEKYDCPIDKDRLYSGWINEVKGCIAQGNSIEEVKEDLLKVYWIKRAVENKREKDDKRKSKKNT